jgi:hypothetical protein
MEGPRVNDPERTVGTRAGRVGEVPAVVAHGNRHDQPVGKLGEGRLNPANSLGRRHHDGRCCTEEASHTRRLQPPVQRGGIDRHLVQCPRVPEVGHPRLAQTTRQRRGCLGRHVRRHDRVDGIDVLDLEAGGDGFPNPPFRPR